MNKLSIAIPTYNSADYLDILLENLILLNNVNEIIVNDDNSSELEKEKLIVIADKFNKKQKIKIKLFFNDENFGGFKNKYITSEKTSADDNFIFLKNDIE